jgi:hypothetical protein
MVVREFLGDDGAGAAEVRDHLIGAPVVTQLDGVREPRGDAVDADALAEGLRLVVADR